MNDLLQSLSEHPDVSVSIAIGIEHWKTGLTTLIVRGDGDVKVLNQRAGKETVFTGHLSSQSVQEFGAALVQADFSALPPSAQTNRTPGDMPVFLKLQQGETTQLDQRVWHGDRYKDKKVNAIIMQFENLVAEVANTELAYGSPQKKQRRFWRRGR